MCSSKFIFVCVSSGISKSLTFMLLHGWLHLLHNVTISMKYSDAKKSKNSLSYLYNVLKEHVAFGVKNILVNKFFYFRLFHNEHYSFVAPTYTYMYIFKSILITDGIDFVQFT